MLDIYNRLFEGGKRASMPEDVIRLRGCYEVVLRSAENDEVVEYFRKDNTVVTSGRSYVLSRIQSSSPQTDVINAIAVGTSTAGPTTGDTLLGSESVRISISSFVTSGLTNNPPSWQAQCTFGTGQGNTTLGEAGIFNSTAANSQTMLSHVTFSTIWRKLMVVVKFLLIDSNAVMPTRANLCVA